LWGFIRLYIRQICVITLFRYFFVTLYAYVLSILYEMIKKYKIFFLFLTLIAGSVISVAQKTISSNVAINNAMANTIAVANSYVDYIENKGQWNDKTLYQADFNGGRIFLEKNALTYVFYPPGGLERLHPHANSNPADFTRCSMTFQAVRMLFVGSMPASIEGGDKKSFYSNYFLGKDPKHWASGVGAFGNVHYNDIYPGISVKVFSDMNNVRYDFLVDPNANISLIKLQFAGQNKLFLNQGQLVIKTEIGDIIQARPIAYQEINGNKVKVDCNFILHDDILGFEVKGAYDASKPLVIDPTLVFSTFTGSKADNWGMSATYDATTNAYTSGICFAIGYPVTPGAFEMTFQGGGTGGGNVWPAPDNTGFDIVISKFNPIGTKLLFSTYLGGTDNEEPQSLVVDNANNLLVLGRTYSTDFPVTAGAFQTVQGGGADLIVSKFDSSGTKLLASTYVGGSGDDGVNISDIENYLGSLKYNYADDGRGDIVVDMNNNVYVASCTSSNNFPVTPGAFQAFSQGMQDGCAFKLSSNLSGMVWGTYLGGNADDAAYNIALNSAGEAYIAGGTASPNFPTTPGTLQPTYSGAIDGFLVHLSGAGKMLQATYLGTTGYDQAYFVQTDKYNNVYVYGQTSGKYPIIGTVYSNPGSGQFIHEMNPTLSSTIFSTEFGSGRGTPDIAPSAFLVDNCLNIYISGWGGALYGYNNIASNSIGLPTTSNAYRSSPNITSAWTSGNPNGQDFYFAVFKKQADSLWYATYFGSTGGNAGSLAHVDGGTSRFDKKGVIYQAICGGCGGYSDIPTTPGAWSATNDGPNCNNALVKFQMDLIETVASFIVSPAVTAGCAPFAVNFKNTTSYGQTFKWYFGDGDSSYAVAPSHIYGSPGTYEVLLVATDSTTCNLTDTGYAVVRVVPPVTLSSTSSMICVGDSTSLNVVNSLGTNFSWTPASGLNSISILNPKASPTTTTSYIITAKDSFCTAIDTVVVSVYSNQTTIIPKTGQLCVGDSVQLTTDSSYVSYAWSTGQTSSAVEVNHAGPFSVTTIDKHGCKGKDSIEVTAFSKVPLIERDTAVCLKHGVQLYADSGSYTYLWLPASGLNINNVYDPTAIPMVTTTYTVTVTNGPCVSKDSITITVKPIPYVKIIPDSVMIIPGASVTLNATGSPPFNWSPSIGISCTECPSPTVAPDSNTVYYAQVADSDGCIAIDSAIVDIEPTIYVPNSFTPNGDGKNDVFRPKFQGYISMEVYIFNRWGQLIYKWNTLDGGWDGTYEGRKAQEDTYVYMLKAVDYTKNLVQKIGSVTLLK
jgi:gliding motility-associated-like protein